MKYVDEYRDVRLTTRLMSEIRQSATRPWTLMEVCGGQTHGLLRYGIVDALQGVVELIHGPGCPVCVTPVEQIDFAIRLAQTPGMLLATFGDMLRVPGSRTSLLDARAAGAQVRMVYSPLDAVEIAAREPQREVVFFAVGFETTAPATAVAVCQAAERGLKNFSLLVAHVRVLPAMEQLVLDPHSRIDAFLAAGHVCTITGLTAYHDFVSRSGRPVVVTGFEPVDLLSGISAAVQMLERGERAVINQYERSVAEAGNVSAWRWVEQVYEPVDLGWRGLGTIAEGGFRLRDRWSDFDARHRWPEIAACSQTHSSLPDPYANDFLRASASPTRMTVMPSPSEQAAHPHSLAHKSMSDKSALDQHVEPSNAARSEPRNAADSTALVWESAQEVLPQPAWQITAGGKLVSESTPLLCLAADVLTGRIKPTQCPHFGKECTPDRPLGAPMVSAEGACAAYYRYLPPSGQASETPVAQTR